MRKYHTKAWWQAWKRGDHLKANNSSDHQDVRHFDELGQPVCLKQGMSNEFNKDAERCCLHRLVLWTWQGCGYLEGYGYHPGSGFVAFLIALGAAAGAEGGWVGSICGAGAMAATFGLLYLVGAYGRAKDFHSQKICVESDERSPE